MRRTVLALSVFILSTAALAQVPAADRTKPTAEVDKAPRTISELNVKRSGARDAVMAGGNAASLPESRVELPTICDLNPSSAGCSGESGGGATPPDPGPGSGGGGSAGVGPCGFPADHPWNQNPYYFPIHGGYMVEQPGYPTLYVHCP